jgi:hypothetical protein
MKNTATPPTAPPAIAPVFELLPFGGAVGDPVRVGDTVGDALAEEVSTPGVYTPDAPKIAPGPYSG